MKKIIAYLLVFAMLFSLFAVPVSAVSLADVWSGIVAVSDVVGVYQTATDIISLVSNGTNTGANEFDRLSGGGATRGGGAGRRPVEYATGGSGDYGYFGGASSSGAGTDHIYTGIGEGGATSYYQAVNSVNNTWYNPVTCNYSTTLNMSYSPTYNTYHIEDNEYNSYVIDNVNYVSYYITENETGSTWYYEIYYQLPDGRYSYDLTAEEVWGTYFIYDAVNYDEVVEDDGTTLALLHFDGNILDSSAHNNAVTYTQNASYNFIDSDFTSALSWSDSQAHKMTVALPENLSGDFTIEGRIKISDTATLGDYVCVAGASSGYYYEQFVGANEETKARSRIEQILGTGGSYSKSASGLLTYTKNGAFQNYGNGPGRPVISLGDSSYSVYLFRGNGTFNHNYNSYKAIYYPQTGDILFLPVGSASSGYEYSQTLDQHISFAFVRSGDTVTYYENGLKKYSYDFTRESNNVLYLRSTAGQSIVFDELRVSNKALYTDTYTPSSQPFDTNLVLVLPKSGELNQIAVKSNIAVSDLRVGGVRPTYPSNGDVYVYLENDVVKDVQQYQIDGWYSVDACIYEGDAGWTSLANYDLSAYVSEAPEGEGDSGGSGDAGGSGDSGGGDSSGSGDVGGSDDAGVLGELISSIFGGVVDAISAALKGLLSIFTALIEFCTGFGSFLRSAFTFIPSEIISVITAGITLMVILAIIKFIRG